MLGKEWKSVKFAIHSKCCNAHWELVHMKDGKWDLWCEKCHTPVGSDVHVTGPDLNHTICSRCEKEVKEE